MPADDSFSRNIKQMSAFLGSGAVAIGAAMVARRSITARKYVPRLFEANHRPPDFNMVKDALQAVGQASVLSVSTFAFFLSGAIWVLDIKSSKDFSKKMVNLLGGTKKQDELAKMPISPEVKEIEDNLESLFKK